MHELLESQIELLEDFHRYQQNELGESTSAYAQAAKTALFDEKPKLAKALVKAGIAHVQAVIEYDEGDLEDLPADYWELVGKKKPQHLVKPPIWSKWDIKTKFDEINRCIKDGQEKIAYIKFIENFEEIYRFILRM